MQDWLNLVDIAESVVTYTEDCDAIIWAFDSSSKFTVQTMYKIVSFRAIQPVYSVVVWNLNIPPRIHIFLWLLSNKKLSLGQNGWMIYHVCSVLKMKQYNICSLIVVWPP